MFSCQPLHTHIRHSRDGYSAARRIVFAVTCVLLLAYGADEVARTASPHAPVVQTAALGASAADMRALFDDATLPGPVLRSTVRVPAVGGGPTPQSSATCVQGPIHPGWSSSCLSIEGLQDHD